MLLAGVVHISDLCGTLQHADLGDTYNRAFIGRKALQIHGLHISGSVIRDGLAGDIDDSAPNSDAHGRGLDVHGLI